MVSLHAYIVCTNVCNMYVCSGPRPRQQIVIKNKMYVTMQIFFSAGINLEYTSRPFFHFDMSFFLYSSPRFQSNFNHICSNQINSLCRFDMSRFLAASTQNNKASNRQIMIFFATKPILSFVRPHGNDCSGKSTPQFVPQGQKMAKYRP